MKNESGTCEFPCFSIGATPYSPIGEKANWWKIIYIYGIFILKIISKYLPVG